MLKHPINHVLIQHYRDGNDYISEHSDKTLDIARGSKIVNVSLGAQRTMVLRMKKGPKAQSFPTEQQDGAGRDGGGGVPDEAAGAARRDMQRIPMPHNSMFVLGLETNKKWTHGIRQDKRAANIKSAAELACNGERISLTFRHIATWLSSDEQRIYGQGAAGKTAGTARPVVSGDGVLTEKLLAVFGAENQRADFDWEAHYGAGSDVLHFQEPQPRIVTAAGAGAPDVATARVKICLHEKQRDFVEQAIPPQQLASLRTYSARGEPPVFVDTDRERTAVSGSLAILQYLEMFCAPPPAPPPAPSPAPPASDGPWLLPSPMEERAKYALALTRLQEADRLWRTCLGAGAGDEAAVAAEAEAELEIWDGYLRRSAYAAGDAFSLVDIAVYPVLRQVEQERRHALGSQLVRYLAVQAQRPSIQRTYGTSSSSGEEAEVATAAAAPTVVAPSPARQNPATASAHGGGSDDDGGLAGLECELAKVSI